MVSTFIFKAESENHYCFCLNKKKILLCHPVLYHLIKMYKEGIELGEWINNNREDKIILDNYGLVHKNHFIYYYKKFMMLLENDYFENINIKEKLKRRLEPEQIVSIIANMRQVTFEVTDSCNLKCEYCVYGKFYTGYDKRKNKNLNINTAKNLLSYLLNYWNSNLNTSYDKTIYISFYGGEPLLNLPFIQEIVDFVRNMKLKHNRIIFSMTINGTLLEKYMDFIVENDFNLLISLDGSKKNNAYRVFKNGKPAYDLIYRNIISLRKLYPVYFKNKVNFNAVLHNRNSVSEISKYFISEFEKKPIISELSTGGINTEKRQLFWKTYSNVNGKCYSNRGTCRRISERLAV